MSIPQDDNAKPDKQSLIDKIMALLAKVSEKFEPEDEEMKQWMMQHIDNPVIAELLSDTTIMGLRVVDAIGQLEPVNGITISEHFRIPKGTVSKVTRRLLTQKLISSEALPNNRKEILFRLTPLGKELFHAHRAFDQQMESGFVQFLQRYDAGELGFLVRMLHDVVETSFLNLKTNSVPDNEITEA